MSDTKYKVHPGTGMLLPPEADNEYGALADKLVVAGYDALARASNPAAQAAKTDRLNRLYHDAANIPPSAAVAVEDAKRDDAQASAREARAADELVRSGIPGAGPSPIEVPPSLDYGQVPGTDNAGGGTLKATAPRPVAVQPTTPIGKSIAAFRSGK